MRILVVDLSEARRKSFEEKLIDHRVVMADNYIDAALMLELTPRFDLVYLDHDLKPKTGLDLIRFVTSNLMIDRWPRRVIIHSQDNLESRRIKYACDLAGIWCLIRPFPPS